MVTFALSEVVFRPLVERFDGQVWVIVFADDFLILGASAAVVAEAMDCIRILLAETGIGTLSSKPGKTLWTPVDLRKEKLTFVGKELHRNKFHTPYKKKVEWARQYRAKENPIDRRARALSILGNMTPKERASFHGFYPVLLKEVGRPWAQEFKRDWTIWSTKGAVVTENDGAEDLYDEVMDPEDLEGSKKIDGRGHLGRDLLAGTSPKAVV